MSWASEKAAEIFLWGRPTTQVPFGTNRLATIERAIRETIEECARRIEAQHGGNCNCVMCCARQRVLAMLGDGEAALTFPGQFAAAVAATQPAPSPGPASERCPRYPQYLCRAIADDNGLCVTGCAIDKGYPPPAEPTP